MSNPLQIISILTHLSTKLCEFDAIVTTAFTKKVSEAEALITKIHETVLHELKAPDRHSSLICIEEDLERIVASMQSAARICSLVHLAQLHTRIVWYEQYIHGDTEILLRKIRYRLGSMINAYLLKSERDYGKPMALCIDRYNPWDTPKSKISGENTYRYVECMISPSK
jgi:hypothetical protein